MKKIACVLISVFAVGCGSSSTAPTSSPPVVTPPVAQTFTLSGTVTSTTGNPVNGATVRVVDGTNAGKSTTTGSSGAYSLAGLAVAGQTVNASASFYTAASKGVSTTSNQTLDFQLAPVPLFALAGKGDNVFTLPASVAKVHVTGHFVDQGSNSNFIVNLNGRLFINEILRTADYDGVLLTTGGGQIVITNSGSIQWTFTEVR